MIYMDKAATSYHKPEEVAKAVYEAVKATGNSGRGANSASLNSTKMLYDTREKLCKLFNGKDSSRIAFTHNATEALNIVIRGLFKEGDHIITTEAEHNSVLRPLYRSRKEENIELTLSFISFISQAINNNDIKIKITILIFFIIFLPNINLYF